MLSSNMRPTILRTLLPKSLLSIKTDNLVTYKKQISWVFLKINIKKKIFKFNYLNLPVMF